MNPFSHWKSHDVAAHNERVAKRLRTEAAHNPGQDNAPLEVRSRTPPESDLHDKIADHCWQKGWLPIHTRMDKPTTFVIPNDTMRVSDFIILRPAPLPWLAVECKRPGQKATPKQLAFLAYCAKLGATTGVVDNWEDALLLLK